MTRDEAIAYRRGLAQAANELAFNLGINPTDVSVTVDVRLDSETQFVNVKFSTLLVNQTPGWNHDGHADGMPGD